MYLLAYYRERLVDSKSMVINNTDFKTLLTINYLLRKGDKFRIYNIVKLFLTDIYIYTYIYIHIQVYIYNFIYSINRY